MDPSSAGDPDLKALLRRLPKVDDVLGRDAVKGLLEHAPRWAVVAAVRAEIEKLRARLVAERQGEVEVDEGAVAMKVAQLLEPSLVRVLNATGVVLHTNLGRAPLPRAAIERMAEVSRGYSNLEYRLGERRRGSRHEHVSELLSQLTGAEDALVVNNCAGAVLLALAAHAAGRAAIVSRGELVEIGGSFRVPDVMRASGVALVEVGTTNRTHLHDYERAIGPDTALLLKVHRSNFAIVGFTTEVEPAQLVTVARARGLKTMVDLGSGALADLRALGLAADEPRVGELAGAGVDLITFSGDKLLGGPQAGVLVGTRAAIEACKKHPLLRALRPSKITLAALEATLELYRDGRTAEIPALAMLGTPEPTLEARARRLVALCAQARADLRFEAVRVRSAVGGGALPTVEPWSWAVAVTGAKAEDLDAYLRAAQPPVVARIAEDRLLLDARTLADDELADCARGFTIR